MTGAASTAGFAAKAAVTRKTAKFTRCEQDINAQAR